MERLIAKSAVLYQGRQYEPGEPLPAYDPLMVDAWLRAGTAKMVSDAKLEETPAGDDNGQDGLQDGQYAPEVVDGHLDPTQLAGMKKDALEKLAAQLGVDISAAKNNGERAAIISAVLVKAHADNGSAQ